MKDVEQLNNKKYSKNYSLFVKAMVVPSCSSLLEKVSMHPIDTVLTVQQKNNITARKAIKAIYNEVGLLGFYRGMSYPLLFSTPFAAMLLYGSYAWFRDFFSHTAKLDPTKNLIATSISAGLLFSLISTPIEAKRVRDTFGIKSKYPKNKILYYYRGFVPNTIKMLSSTAIILSGTEILKKKLDDYSKTVHNDALQKILNARHPYTAFLGGFILGGVAQIISTPLDVVKTKVMCDYEENSRRLSNWQQLTRVYKERSLFRGLTTRIVRLGGHSGIMLGFMQMLNDSLLEKDLSPNKTLQGESKITFR
jgi:hypothetical protein